MATNKNKEYTWQDVAEHNTEKSCWVYMNDIVYDITSFINKHPGGKDVIMLAAGRDITDLFASYHPFTERPKNLIEQYEIGKLKGSAEFGSFKPDSGFYKELCKRVGKYFKDNNIDYKSPYAGIIRYFSIIFTLFFCWFISMYYHDYILLRHRVYLMIICGICQGLTLIHTMHDCSHTSLSHKPFVWKWLGRITMDFTCGTSFDAWLHQHVLGHHVYTNILKVDPDLPVENYGDMRRVTLYQYYLSKYKYQYLYLPILYSLYAFKNRVQDLTHTLFSGCNGSIRVNPYYRDNESYIRQVVSKSLWLVRTIIIPLFVWKNNLFELLLLFVTLELTTGYFLTYNFQVSHISTEVTWPEIKKDKNDKLVINGEWAKVQIETCVDYAHTSQWCTFFSGALNYQSVHHLFPCVSQYHYPQIAPIILKTCEEYNVKFNHVPSFTKAFYLHVKQLYDMGQFDEHVKKID